MQTDILAAYEKRFSPEYEVQVAATEAATEAQVEASAQAVASAETATLETTSAAAEIKATSLRRADRTDIEEAPMVEPTPIRRPERGSYSWGKRAAAVAAFIGVSLGISDLVKPSNPTPVTAAGVSLNAPTSIVLDGAQQNISVSSPAVNEQGQETAGDVASYDPAGHGSCSPYNREMGRQAQEGKFMPFGDFKDVQSRFLRDHSEFNANFTAGARQRLPYLFEGLGLDKDATMAEATANDHYAQGTLVNALGDVQNTFCDAKGTVHNYAQTVLEPGTGVGGIQIKETVVENGKTFVVLSNDKKIELPATALVGKVQLLDGTEVDMLITNKLGVKVPLRNPDGTQMTDKEGNLIFVLVGCDNELTKIIITPPRTTVTSTPGTSTSVPGTTVTTGSTTTTPSTSTSTSTTTPSTSTSTTTPSTSTSTSTTSTSTSTTRPTTSTSTSIPSKHDDGEKPGDGTDASQDPGTHDVPGTGPAGQDHDDHGYVPGEHVPSTQPPSTTTEKPTVPTSPATTGPAPTPTQPPAPATTSVATTVPQSGPRPTGF